jgi:hypothetical protein
MTYLPCIQRLNIVFKHRQRLAVKARGDTSKKVNFRDRKSRAVPAPEANAELQENIQVCKALLIVSTKTHLN